MPDLIQVADDLKHMPDGWLAQQAQQPSGMVPPYLVMAEMQRREKLRSGQSKAQAPESSVAQDMIRNLYAKIPPTAGLMPQEQPPGAVPPGMPPVNLTPSAGALGPTAPGNLRVPPTRTMADGGEVDDEDEGDLYNLPLTQEPSRDRLMQQLYIPPAQPAPPAQPVMSPRGSANRSAGRGLFNAPGKYDAYVRAAAEETKLDPDFIRSVMNVESNQNPNAVSGAGAVGLMQVLPSTAMSEFGVTAEQLRNPATNIMTGARYLRKLVDLYHGDQRTAAMAYNMGPGNIAKGRTNQGYADKVLDNFQKLHEQGGAPPVQETGGMPGWLASSRSWNIPQVPDTGDAASAVGMGSADTGTAETPAAGTPAAPVTAAPAAAPVKQAPLQQVWNPPPSTQVADLDKQIAAFQKGHQSVDERTKALFGDDNIDLLNQAAGKLIGARPDYSQYQSAINNVMQVAQKQMHPSIGGALMQFGLALMSSKSHYFGQAVGEAGSYAFAAMQKQQQQATRDFLDAAKAGVNLQEHISLYDEKLTQYKMARLGAMQTGITADEKSYQSELAGLMKKRDQAAAAFDKANSTPAANNVRAIAILNENRSAFDPSQYKDPMQQVAALFPQAVDQAMGKTTKTAPAMTHNAAVALTTSTDPEEQKRGQEFLAAENKAEAAKVTAHTAASEDAKRKAAEADMPNMAASVADYSAPLSMFMSRMPWMSRESLLAQVHKINPTYQEWQYNVFKQNEEKFTGGKQGQRRTDLNSAIYHMGQLYDAIGYLKTGNVKALNAVAQSLGAQVGPTAAQTFQTLADAVSPELTKVYVPGGGTKEDREINRAAFMANLPEEQLRRNVAQRAHLIQGVARTMQQEYDAGTYGRGHQKMLFDPQHQLMNRIMHLKTAQEIQQYAASHNITPEVARQAFASKGWGVEE